MCYLQLLATSHSLFVAFEADVGCLDDDAVKRQKSNLEHFHSVIFTIGPCQGLMCNLPRGSMQYLGVGLELRAIGGVSRHVLQLAHHMRFDEAKKSSLEHAWSLYVVCASQAVSIRARISV